MLAEHETKLGGVAAILAILASIFIIFQAVVSIYQYIPISIIFITASIIIASLSYAVSRPLYNFFSTKLLIRRQTNLARQVFIEFKKFVEIVDVWFAVGRSDNLLNVINSMAGLPDFNDKNFRQMPYALGELFSCFKERVKRFDGTKTDLVLLIHEFEKFVGVYADYIKGPVEIVRRIGKDKVPPYTQEDYRKYKGNYDHFIREYLAFGKAVNDRFGETICSVYIDLPPEL